MTTPFWCLLIACLIPYVLGGIGGYHKSQQFEKVDNNEPREQAAKLTGAGARVVAAQSNAWEALAVFAPAVLVNHVAGEDPGMAATLATVWVVARVAHAGFYLADVAPARSASFLVGLICAIWLFVGA